MTNAVRWWCSADGVAWTWVPRAYVGVWIIMIVVALGYSRAVRGTSSADRAVGWIGVACLWLALDWPLGPLGAGYLATAHTVQFLLITMVASPLLLIGLRTRVATLGSRAGYAPMVRRVTSPLPAAILFNLVAIASHSPPLIDALMVSQLGAFAVDAAWLLGGFVFWWPVLVRVPGWPMVHMPVTMLYLFLGTLFHTGIAVVLLVAAYPLYGIYELAPPFSDLSALADQQVAGGLMEVGGTGLIIVVISVLFFRWADERAQPP